MATQSSAPPGWEKALDLSSQPPISISSSHLTPEDQDELEDNLLAAGAALTYDLQEAGIVISKSTRKARIQHDLRLKGLWTEEVVPEESASEGVVNQCDSSTGDEGTSPLVPVPPKQNRATAMSAVEEVIVLDDSSTASELDERQVKRRKLVHRSARKLSASTAKTTMLPPPIHAGAEGRERLRVVKVEWFNASKAAGEALPFADYLTLDAYKIKKPAADTSFSVEQSHPGLLRSDTSQRVVTAFTSPTHAILERAKEDAPSQASQADRFGRRKFGQRTTSSKPSARHASHSVIAQHAHLLQTTTSEYDVDSSELPDPPAWVKQCTKYSCQRSTPRTNPNDAFMAQLKKIKIARELTNDEIGVRAYATSIAAIAAYPYKISTTKEILQLPGCEAKIANLWVEWMNTGKISYVDELEADETIQRLHLFYNIWDVGPKTAREFYLERGWRDLDDIVEYGWKTLSRTQQIGVKYYEEFLDPIPRKEVESIGAIIQAHAEKVRDSGIQSIICGGYRRGKEASGDVDIIVSHPDESKTLNIINDLVASLEEEGWITHTLTLSVNNSSRDQQTLPYRSGNNGGHGFDSLDKALVVWQDPNWPNKAADLSADPQVKNPNIHRRVDIIVSPWRTVGCAVEGWSSGTTFQRDLRRYVKATRGWKFDSSGVRDRGSGEVIDVEGFYKYDGKIGEGRATSMEQAEQRVFEGLGLAWRDPKERCTG